MKIFVNDIDIIRVTFKIKTGYYLELLTPETMILLGSTENKITTAMYSWSFVHSHFLWKKPQCGMRWLFDYFLRFVNEGRLQKII